MIITFRFEFFGKTTVPMGRKLLLANSSCDCWEVSSFEGINDAVNEDEDTVESSFGLEALIEIPHDARSTESIRAMTVTRIREICFIIPLLFSRL